MKTKKLITTIAIAMMVFAMIGGVVSAKSLYLIADHSSAQFDAWNINADSTVTYQTKVNLAHATDPAGIAIDESSNMLFISSEFSLLGLEIVNASTMTLIGKSDTGVSDIGGVEVDDANNIVYAIKRENNLLYAYDWNSGASTLTLKTGYPIVLPGCTDGYGISLDEINSILWVADCNGNKAIAYDVNTWTEKTTMSFTPIHKPVDIAIDRIRGIVYTVSMSYGAWTGGGSDLLSKYDLATKTETTVDLGHQGVGIAVDEVSGCVYITGDQYTKKLEVWDTSTNPWTKVDTHTLTGSPAGICIPQEDISYNPLHFTKDDGIASDECITAGNTLTYNICYDNLANNYDVTNVVIVDNLPVEVNFISATNGGVYDLNNHTVTWNIGTLVAGTAQQCVQLVVQVDPATTPGSTFTNSVTIDSSETPPTTVMEVTNVCSIGPTPTPTPTSQPATSVPTSTPYGIMVLIGLMMIVGIIVLRRKD